MLGDYWVVPEVLTKKGCQVLIDYGDAKCQQSRVNTGSELIETKRRSKNTWIDPKDLEKEEYGDLRIAFRFVVQAYLKAANEVFKTPIDYLEQVQFTKYEKGDFYQWHMDAASEVDTPASFRDVSATMLLSEHDEDFEGGFLRFFPHPAPARKFKQGDLIVFPSLYPHKVSHVRSGTRYSLVIWGGGLHPEKYFRMKKQQELNRQAKKDGSWGVASEP